MLSRNNIEVSLQPSTRDVERAIRSRSTPVTRDRDRDDDRDDVEAMVHALENVQMALEASHLAMHQPPSYGDMEIDVTPLRDAAAAVARLARAAGLSSGQTLVLLDRSFRAIDACRGATECCRSYSVVMMSASRAYFDPADGRQ